MDTLDIREHGRAADGRDLAVDRRLFIQFSAFGNCRDAAPLITACETPNSPCASTRISTIRSASAWSRVRNARVFRRSIAPAAQAPPLR